MRIDITHFIESLSKALDFAEKAILNVEPNHGLRVAILTNRMAEYLQLDKETIYSLTFAAAMHDCALSEYLSDELSEGYDAKEIDMAQHCIAGEEILKNIPIYENILGSVLYYHERTDGKGAFGYREDDVPLFAQIIHMADAVDVRFGLYTIDEQKYMHICSWINANKGSVFSEKCGDALINSVDYDVLESVAGDNSIDTFDRLLTEKTAEIDIDILKKMSKVFAEINDYKSHFTWRHSIGIAKKAEEIGQYYKFDKEECGKLYVAGALHDIGKLLTDNTILEKMLNFHKTNTMK